MVARSPHVRQQHERGRRRSRTLAAAVSAVIALTAALVGIPIVASADGPTSFADTAPVAIPATGSMNQIGPASPYPSTVDVSGLAGTVSAVTVTLSGLSHSALNDVDAMLVAPGGANLVFLSDIGDPETTLAFATNATLTFSDAAGAQVPTGNVSTGTYLPTNRGAGDPFPAPAPTASSQTTFGGAFTGIVPNGTWSLYLVDDATGDIGTLAGGWSLTVTTTVSDVPTVTAVATSGTPAATGTPVTFTASVTADGAPVDDGAVQFRDGTTALGAPVPVSASGTASLTTSTLAEGTHEIRAEYGGATGFSSSNGTVSQRVDNATVVNGSTFCNPGALTVPQSGTATPYPSNITVSGLPTALTKVTATLHGISHTAPIDLDVMLSAPSGASAMLLSDVGGQLPVSGATVTLDDDAASSVTGALSSGTFRPTDDDLDAADAAFPAPAPTSGPATLSVFDGADPNGTWSLWVVDDATGDAGSISGGWCLTFTTQAATTTSLTSSDNPALVGQPVTLTATVTSQGSPVTTGTVVFLDGASPLGPAVALAADGTATLTTSDLAAGTHGLTASYAASDDYAESNGILDQVVSRAVTTTTLASSGNPSLDGQTVTFTALVTAAGAPVTTGYVQFDADTTPLGLPVALGADGTATFTTSSLSVGTHAIGASFGGTPALEASTTTLTQLVGAVVADAGGPYTVAEGAALRLDASGSTPGAVYAWDLDGDDDFDDAAGVDPVLTWSELEAFGIDDGPADHAVAVRVTLGTVSTTDAALVHVDNTPPRAVLTGSLTATVGRPFTIKVGADDPSSADLAAQFAYTVDWGDGSPVETVLGPADPPVTHTYGTAGLFTASFTATDKDAGVSEPTTVLVLASPAPAPPAPGSPSTTTARSALVRTGGESPVASLLAAGAFVAAGAALLLAARARAHGRSRP